MEPERVAEPAALVRDFAGMEFIVSGASFQAS